MPVRLFIAAITVLLALSSVSNTSFARGERGRVRLELTDRPGPWFENETPIPGTSESLAIARPGVRVKFEIGGKTETVHTVTSLLWPLRANGANARGMPFDQEDAHRSGGLEVTLRTPGLYVFTCKVHPYMFGAVIVDNPRTPGLDLGDQVRLFTGVTVPSNSDLAVRLLRTFFVVTDPSNWQDYTSPDGWNVTLPPVDVRITDGQIVNLSIFDISNASLTLNDPPASGIGEVWVNTQFEMTANKDKFGSATSVDTATWKLKRKVALPEIELNHPHNMWADMRQETIYQTQWFDSKMAVFDRSTGRLIENMTVGDAPSHVMTSPVDDSIYVALNGENDNRAVVQIDPDTLNEIDELDIGAPHPHGHWISADGATMVTPNQFTDSSSIVDLLREDSTAVEVGTRPNAHPIATGMMPDGSKYYQANFLDHTISVIDVQSRQVTKEINLIEHYDPITGAISGPIGGLPLQTPVSPDGKYVVTANVLGPTVTIIDTRTDELILHLPCDAGCHGVQFGAKSDGGYYAYVSNKFSNALIIFDPQEAIAADQAGNGNGILDAEEDKGVVARVLLATGNAGADFEADDFVIGHDGMGGQGVLPIPNVYNGWVQKTVDQFDALSPEIQGYICQLTSTQMDPDGPVSGQSIPAPDCS